jgi:hypothetical protein
MLQGVVSALCPWRHCLHLLVVPLFVEGGMGLLSTCRIETLSVLSKWQRIKTQCKKLTLPPSSIPIPLNSKRCSALSSGLLSTLYARVTSVAFEAISAFSLGEEPECLSGCNFNIRDLYFDFRESSMVNDGCVLWRRMG